MNHFIQPVALTTFVVSAATAQTAPAAPDTPASAPAPMLSPVTVTGASDRHMLPPAAPGGQVAKGSRLGILGNADVMTTPFSVKSYTSELIKNQGARSVDDLMANDPSARVSLSPGFVLDQSSIRGFTVNAGAYTIDGLPGMVSYSRIPVQNFERIEVFKGPTSALGGASVSGTAVGGSVNLVSKRANVTPDASVTVGASGRSVLETHVDLGRRFGDDKAWGLRLNVLGEKGEMSTTTKRENLTPQLALDYAGDRLRATLDASQIHYENRKPGVNHTLAAGQPVPVAPDGARTASPADSQQALDARYAIAGVEFDLHPGLTAYAKYGRYHEESVDSFTPSYGALRGDGSFTVTNYVYNTWKTDQTTRDVGLRAAFATGAVKHEVSVSSLRFHRLYTVPPTGQGTPPLPPLAPFTPVTGSIYADYPIDDPFDRVRPAVGPYTGTPIVQRSLGVADSMKLIDDRLNIVLGLRRQEIRQEAVPPAAPYDSTRTTPTLGLSFQLGGGWTAYGNHAEQLSQGAVAPSGTTNAGESLAPFVGKQNEVGAKWDAGRFGLTLAAFDIRQASAFTDPADNTFKAAGEQRHRGVEVETFGEPLAGLRLLGGVAYIDGKQSKTLNGATDGKRALGVSDFNLNLGGEWDVAALPGFTLTGRVIHTGDAYVDAANTQRLPSWTRVDVGARYATRWQERRLTLRVGINNLADRDHWQSGGRNIFVAAEPRTWRVSATVDF